jgi:hypothetical protein
VADPGCVGGWSSICQRMQCGSQRDGHPGATGDVPRVRVETLSLHDGPKVSVALWGDRFVRALEYQLNDGSLALFKRLMHLERRH